MAFKASQNMLNVLELSLKNWYNKPNTKIIYTEKEEANYSFSEDIIRLGVPILQDFYNNKVPCMSVFYHELGHVLYTETLEQVINNWRLIYANDPSKRYKDEYFHLLNWIEDFFIEETLLQNYPYLEDILTCIRKPPSNYDIKNIKLAFSYYYIYGKPSPALSPQQQNDFISYIKILIQLRRKIISDTIISRYYPNKVSNQFVLNVIDFYDWCLSIGIFEQQQSLPAQPHPMIIPSTVAQQSNQQQNNQQQSNQQSNQQQNNTNSNKGTSSTTVSTSVGKLPTMQQFVAPMFNDTTILKAFETEYTKFEYGRTKSKVKGIDGLFTSRYKQSNIITNNLNIRNYINPVTRSSCTIFNKQIKSFNNVSIYRDISGSTNGQVHRQMNTLIKFLVKKIPIRYHFYLYASGIQASIIEEQFIDWENYNQVPNKYKSNPMFNQLGKGTDSGAIANIIHKQLSDKWLNIVVTDGDLSDLFRRTDIQKLLDNVFIIFVGDSTNYIKQLKPNQYVSVAVSGDLKEQEIMTKLLTYGGN